MEDLYEANAGVVCAPGQLLFKYRITDVKERRWKKEGKIMKKNSSPKWDIELLMNKIGQKRVHVGNKLKIPTNRR